MYRTVYLLSSLIGGWQRWLYPYSPGEPQWLFSFLQNDKRLTQQLTYTQQKYKRNTHIFCNNNNFRNFIEIAYLGFTFCCYSAVHFSWWKKNSSNDLAKSWAIRRWGSQRQDHTISTQSVLHLLDTKMSIVICGMFSHFTWRVYAVGHRSPEVDVGDELPGQGRPKRVLLGTNPWKMLVKNAHVRFHHPETLCKRGRREIWHCRAGNLCCSVEQRAGRSGTVSHRGIWHQSD